MHLLISLILFLGPGTMVGVIDIEDVAAGRGVVPLVDGSDPRLIHIPVPPPLLKIKSGDTSPTPVPGPGLHRGTRRPSHSPDLHPRLRRRNHIPVLAHLSTTKINSLPPREPLRPVLSWIDLGIKRGALCRHMIAIAIPDPPHLWRINDGAVPLIITLTRLTTPL